MGRIEGIENPAFVDFFKTIDEEKSEKKKKCSDVLIHINEGDDSEEDISPDSSGSSTDSTPNETSFGNVPRDIPEYSPGGQDMIKCKVTRDRRGLDVLGYPIYKMVLDDGVSPGKFILAARKRKKAKTSSYLISTSAEDLGKDSPNYVAKVRSNVMGTRFVSYDNGKRPEQSILENEIRQEFCAIIYEQNVLGFKGPRKMTIVLPKCDENGNRTTFKPLSEKTSLLGTFDEGNLQDITVHHNRQPQWNESTQSYVLNFNGRVSQASVKNFQITKDNDPTHTIMQFGRIRNDVFTLDYRFPLSSVQALSIALSSFDHKIACE